MPTTLIAIPVKPFGVAKRRLSPMLNATERRNVGRAVAGHVIATALATRQPTAVVTGDRGVADWAQSLGASVIAEPPAGGLNGAARAVLETAHRRRLRWMIVHADLPALRAEELEAALASLPDGGVVLCPSYNGGTSLLAADLENFAFHYGPGSFRRHLAGAVGRPHRILIRTGLVLDLDDPVDLEAVHRLPAGRWLGAHLPDLGVPGPFTPH